ncbi:MAG: hypothetical protein GF341_12650, partial [candidate division Zixibacteria bacterium]|nr:hypothetical protein [candidate division Zixibacteria bacterium]
MRSPKSRQRLTVPILIVAVALCIVLAPPAHVTSAAADAQSLADSLTRKAAGFYSTEPSVQDILDQLGWNLSAANDEISLTSLCATPGPVNVRILAEYTGLANDGRLLWYPAGAYTDTIEVLDGVASVDDSTVFQLNALSQLAWLYTPR